MHIYRFTNTILYSQYHEVDYIIVIITIIFIFTILINIIKRTNFVQPTADLFISHHREQQRFLPSTHYNAVPPPISLNTIILTSSHIYIYIYVYAVSYKASSVSNLQSSLFTNNYFERFEWSYETRISYLKSICFRLCVLH